MPRASEHLAAGTVVGGFASLATAGDLTGEAFLAHLLGCLLGAWAGSVLPDALEPATSSWHRKFAHSAFLLAGGGTAAATNLPAIRTAVGTRRVALAQSRVQWQMLPANHPE